MCATGWGCLTPHAVSLCPNTVPHVPPPLLTGGKRRRTEGLRGSLSFFPPMFVGKRDRELAVQKKSGFLSGGNVQQQLRPGLSPALDPPPPFTFAYSTPQPPAYSQFIHTHNPFMTGAMCRATTVTCVCSNPPGVCVYSPFCPLCRATLSGS